MAFTREQEETLIKIADRELTQAPLLKTLADAESALAECDARFYAERLAAEVAAQAAISVINVAYAPERSAKTTAVDEAKAALLALADVAIAEENTLIIH